jgi:hypothetical protein
VPTLAAHGIAAPLPSGFEGRIFVRPVTGPGRTYAVAHFATFPLPADVADFGGGAVTLMSPDDIFAVLFEYGPESVGRRLFARQGMPRALGVGDFRTILLRRGLAGQSGTQWFFTEAGRPFTLYVVLGSHARRSALVPRVNQLLAGMAIDPSGLTAVAPTVPGAGATGAPWN